MASTLCMLLWGIVCYRMAEKRGRDTIIALIIGMLFGIFGVIGYAIAGYKKNNRYDTEREERCN